MKLKLLFSLTLVFSFLWQSTAVFAGDEACGGGDVCYDQRSYSTYSCNYCSTDWYCVDPVTGERLGGCTRFGEGPTVGCDFYVMCREFCLTASGDLGSTCDPYINQLIDCDKSPGKCEAYIQATQCTGGGASCIESTETLTYGCCGPGGAPAPTDIPAPTPTLTPDPECTINSFTSISGNHTVYLGSNDDYTASATGTNGTIDRIEFTVGQTTEVLSPATMQSDSSSPYTQNYFANQLGHSVINAKCVMGGIIRASATFPIDVVAPPPPTCLLSNFTGDPILYLNTTNNPYSVTAAVTNGTLSNITFTLSNPILNPTASPPHTLSTYFQNYTASALGSTTITARCFVDGVQIGAPLDKLVQVVQPTVNVQVNTWDDPNGICDDTNSVADAPEFRLTPPGNWYVSGNPAIFPNIVSTPGSLYTLTMTTMPSGWILSGCGGLTRSWTFDNSNYAIPYVANFYLKQTFDPWFQVNFGDVGSANNISTTIPTSNYFLGPDIGVSSGVAIAEGNININGYLGPDDRQWSAISQTISDFANDGAWFDYFKSTFNQVLVPLTEEVSINQAYFANSIWEWHIDEEGVSKVLYINNNVTLDGIISVPADLKYTVFVDGNLTVNSPSITVPIGSYLGFVVTGNITFDDTTESIDGVYISDQNIIIESINPTADDPFVGNGTFAGKQGVTLARDLDPDNTSTTNDDPAETFNYRSDLLYNAPLGFKRIPLSWQEVEPGTINLTE